MGFFSYLRFSLRFLRDLPIHQGNTRKDLTTFRNGKEAKVNVIERDMYEAIRALHDLETTLFHELPQTFGDEAGGEVQEMRKQMLRLREWLAIEEVFEAKDAS